MDSLCHVQQLQLKLVMSASVSESCAIDLTAVVYKLTGEEAETLLGIIDLLLYEAESLRKISKEVTANHFAYSLC
jgi:hypothetical protein